MCGTITALDGGSVDGATELAGEVLDCAWSKHIGSYDVTVEAGFVDFREDFQGNLS